MNLERIQKRGHVGFEVSDRAVAGSGNLLDKGTTRCSLRSHLPVTNKEKCVPCQKDRPKKGNCRLLEPLVLCATYDACKKVLEAAERIGDE